MKKYVDLTKLCFQTNFLQCAATDKSMILHHREYVVQYNSVLQGKKKNWNGKMPHIPGYTLKAI